MSTMRYVVLSSLLCLLVVGLVGLTVSTLQHAHNAQYLRYAEGRWWRRDFATLTSWGYVGISPVEVPVVLGHYLLYGTQELRQWNAIRRRCIAGKSIDVGNRVEAAWRAGYRGGACQ